MREKQALAHMHYLEENPSLSSNQLYYKDQIQCCCLCLLILTKKNPFYLFKIILDSKKLQRWFRKVSCTLYQFPPKVTLYITIVQHQNQKAGTGMISLCNYEILKHLLIHVTTTEIKKQNYKQTISYTTKSPFVPTHYNHIYLPITHHDNSALSRMLYKRNLAAYDLPRLAFSLGIHPFLTVLTSIQ